MNIIGIIAIAVLCICGWWIEYRRYTINKRKISFKESMDLADLPVITMYQGENKFNFLLDTGSNDSFISKTTSRKLKGAYSKIECSITGMGNDVASRCCITTLQYKDISFECEFVVSPALNEAFETIKKESGVSIHGILGTKFLQKYRYILDFNELVAYKK